MTISTPLIIVNIIIYSNMRGQVMKNLVITPMLEESDSIALSSAQESEFPKILSSNFIYMMLSGHLSKSVCRLVYALLL